MTIEPNLLDVATEEATQQETYPSLPVVERPSRPLSGYVSPISGLVAVAVAFPVAATAHRYDRVYPDDIRQDERGRVQAGDAARAVVRNDPALARQGVARLVRCVPKCRAEGRFHEITTGWAIALGAYACEECYP